jgi:cation:H+ antiporter
MDISVGNVIGSNIFNVLFVLGICPMFQPINIELRALKIDFPIMLAFCLLLVFLVTVIKPKLQLDRKRGFILIVAYVFFLIGLFL